MKKLFLSLLIISSTLLSCTKSNDEKAKDLIKSDLSKKMDDFKSYEPVEFSKLDSNYSEYIKHSFDKYSDTLIGVPEHELILKELDYNNNQLRKQMEFKPEFIGYKMEHSFRGKNKLGATVLNKITFLFDKDLTHVIN